MTRYGSMVKVRQDKTREYIELHRNAWPGVLKRLRECNVTNYSIYYREGWLFSYLEYVGEDFEKDMAAIADDETTQEWWKVCVPCLEPLDSSPKGEIWAPMEEVFHMD